MQLELLATEGLDTTKIETVSAELAKRSPEWLPKGTISIQFVDEATSRQLNKDYAGDDYATDVLTFNYSEDGARAGETLADVAICVPIAEAQAAEAGTELSEELATLALHGILHVAGFDHASPDDQAQVEAMQKDILTAAGTTYRDFKWKE